MPRRVSSPANEWRLVLAMLVLARPGMMLVLLGVALGLLLDPWFLAFGGAFAVIPVLGSLVDRGPLPGRAVAPGEAVELAALVRRVAEALGFHSPLLVRIIPTVDAASFRTRLSGVECVVVLIGWPLIRDWDEAEVAAVVAHELAHDKHQRGRRNRWMIRARDGLVESLDQRIGFPMPLKQRLLAKTQPEWWATEFEADADSARVVGSAAARSALERTVITSAVWSWLGVDWIDELVGESAYPSDFYEALDSATHDPYVDRLARRTADLTSSWEIGHASTHPPLRARLQALPETPPALALAAMPLGFAARDEVESWCVHALVSTDEEADLHPVRVLDNPERFEPDLEEARQHAVVVTGRSEWQNALQALIEDLGIAPSDLGERVDPDLCRLPEPPRREMARDSAALLVGAVLASGLLDQGWSRVSPWTRTVLRDSSGEDHDLVDITRRSAANGDISELETLSHFATGRTT